MTLRHYVFSGQHTTQFSEDGYAFVLWRYVTVQIWRVIELFVPGIVASTIKPKLWSLNYWLFTIQYNKRYLMSASIVTYNIS